ncbi:MAG: hypothetical protein JSS67_10410 [Bacteroidetes bacterium]|nr:hypothetical protein [Bacteroidota bacterium]
MVQQKIELRKIRDLSDNLSDSFKFIRIEFKPLLKSFILIAGVFLLANAIMSGLYQKTAFSFLDSMTTGRIGDEMQMMSTLFTPVYFITIFLTMLSLIAMKTVVACYMKSYIEKNNSPTTEEVWHNFIQYFPRVIIYTIPVTLLILTGFIFCILPGIYLAFVFVPFQFIIVFENKGFTAAFRRCFDLIKRNFWMSIGIYIVSYIIYSFSSGIIGFVVAALAGLASYFTTKEWSSTAGMVMGVFNVVGYVFYLVFLISAFLNYGSLMESRDGTGLLERLETLGKKTDLYKDLEEEY